MTGRLDGIGAGGGGGAATRGEQAAEERAESAIRHIRKS
jgi:hypothetical protein